MAHKKGVGSTDNGRDSKSKRLGVKLFGGQVARAGNIIIRQRGTKYHPGENVYMGKDYTIHAKVDGKVAFRKSHRNRMYVSVVTDDAAVGTAAPQAKAAPKAKAAPAPAAAPQEITGSPERIEELKAGQIGAAEEETVGGAQQEAEAAPQGIADIPQVTPATEDTRTPDVDPTPGKAKAEKVTVGGKKYNIDDLKVVEGIGPKIEGLLHDIGIKTWKDLAETSLDQVQDMLNEAGPRYRIHNPGTWAMQAQLAADGKWEELNELQDKLDGGKE